MNRSAFKQNQADSNKCFANVGLFPSLSCLICAPYSQRCLISYHLPSWHALSLCVRSKISFCLWKLKGKSILMRKINPPCPPIYISLFSTKLQTHWINIDERFSTFTLSPSDSNKKWRLPEPVTFFLNVTSSHFQPCFISLGFERWSLSAKLHDEFVQKEDLTLNPYTLTSSFNAHDLWFKYFFLCGINVFHNVR